MTVSSDFTHAQGGFISQAPQARAHAMDTIYYLIHVNILHSIPVVMSRPRIPNIEMMNGYASRSYAPLPGVRVKKAA